MAWTLDLVVSKLDTGPGGSKRDLVVVSKPDPDTGPGGSKPEPVVVSKPDTGPGGSK